MNGQSKGYLLYNVDLEQYLTRTSTLVVVNGEDDGSRRWKWIDFYADAVYVFNEGFVNHTTGAWGMESEPNIQIVLFMDVIPFLRRNNDELVYVMLSDTTAEFPDFTQTVPFDQMVVDSRFVFP